MNIRGTIVRACTVLVLAAPEIAAQQAAAPAKARDTTSALRVFLDCTRYCDTDYIRTEIPWVDYMRDRADAQLQVLVTQEATGGGGSQYTMHFIGLREWAAITYSLQYNASPNDSQDAIRRGITRVLQIGILPYVARTPVGQRLSISVPAAGGPGSDAAPTMPTHDPWNYWNFRIQFDGFGNGESASNNENLRGSVSANRTTDEWKTNLSLSSSQNLQSFTFPIDDTRDTTEHFFSRSASADGSLVKSLGAQFSAGLTASISTSTFGNTTLSASVQPAVEYDFFPYKESSRRLLTVRYAVGVRSFSYRDTTIFLAIGESLLQHSLSLGYSTTEPWGSANLYSSVNQYLPRTGLYDVGLGGNADLKLFKGFSFNVFGDYSLVRDQLSLRKGSASEADILLRQRELATSFRYFVGVGISYRFGSIFNNIVNPRMGGGGGGMQMMFF